MKSLPPFKDKKKKKKKAKQDIITPKEELSEFESELGEDLIVMKPSPSR